MTYNPPLTSLTKAEKISANNHGLVPGIMSDSYVRLYNDSYSKFTKVSNWQRMSMTTVIELPVSTGYYGTLFDGKYVYYVPYDSLTFVRFNTKGTSFTTASDWQQMSMTTAQGGTVGGNDQYNFATYDGRYIYYCPYRSDTFLRFDTQGTSFTTASDWQRMSMSTAIGGSSDIAFINSTFDGRYVYYSPNSVVTFTRFDTQGTSFTTASDWQNISATTATGGTISSFAFNSATFDGKYIYYIPSGSDTLIRFDTQGTSFTTASDWQKMSLSTAQGSSVIALSSFTDGIFDGRYIYYTPQESDTFLRFDTQGTSFTTASDWQKMSMSTSTGSNSNTYSGTAFDGKYIYFCPYNISSFVRFQTQ